MAEVVAYQDIKCSKRSRADYNDENLVYSGENCTASDNQALDRKRIRKVDLQGNNAHVESSNSPSNLLCVSVVNSRINEICAFYDEKLKQNAVDIRKENESNMRNLHQNCLIQ